MRRYFEDNQSLRERAFHHPDDAEAAPGHGHSHSHAHTKAVLNRLAKATGHLEAIKRMVEDGRDCSEVIVQLAAVKSAINGVSQVIIKDHLEHCIVEAVEQQDFSKIDELNKAIETFIK